MIRRTITIFTALTALVAVTACEEEPDEAVLVSDPVLEEERQQAEAPLSPEDLQPVAGQTEETEETAPPARVPPAVAIVATDVECQETPVFFETDAAELGPEDEQQLDSLVSCIQGTPQDQQLQITGRADPRASESYNEELSRERARAVADYLSEQGISEDRFEIRAMGEEGMSEGMPVLWPAQRRAMVEPTEPTGS